MTISSRQPSIIDIKTFKHIAAHAAIMMAALVIFALSNVASASHVEEVRLGLHPEKTRLVFELSSKMDYNAFILKAPDRLVVDFKGPNLSCAPIKLPNNKVLSFSRLSQDAQTLRLVFSLKKDSMIKSKFLIPASKSQPDRLVIDLLDSKPGVKNYAPAAIAKVSKPAQAKSYTPPSTSSRVIAPAYKPLVVLDPGHGGQDPGAVASKHLFEKQVVLATAKRLRKSLEDSGQYRVIMTRESDKYIRLYERVKIARRHGADLFVSIHADSVETKTVRGASVYTLSEKASDKQTARLAARENKADLIAGVDLSEEGDEVAAILIDLALRDTKNQSTFLANQFVDQFQKAGIKMLRTPLHSAGFAVLKAPDIPSVLVEIGFMSNHSEAKKLNTASHQAKIARALKASIDAYFTKQAYYAAHE